MNIVRRITGWAELSITGASPEAALTLLAARGVPFWDVTPPVDFKLTLKTPARCAEHAAAVAASSGCEAAVTAYHGLPALWRKARRRLTLLIPLAAAALVLAWSLTRVWEITITGNETIPDGVIMQALAACGVEIGADWTSFSPDAIRNGVILRVPEIRWMTVKMTGCHAEVIVREKRTYIEPVDEDELVNIVADKAGFITAVYAKRGTAVAEAGRVCLPGDVLIGGWETGRFYVQGAVRAIGYVTARTWYDITAAAPDTVYVKRQTGETTTRYSLILGKIRVNLYPDDSICPEGCDKITTVSPLARAGVFTLPVAIERTVISAYETEPQPAAELREELEALLMAELEGRIGEDGEIVSCEFTASAADGMLYVTLRAECEERIGKPVPLTDGDLRAIQAKMPTTADNG